MMVRHGGQNSVFAGPDDKLYASFSGADPTAVYRDQPGIVPLERRFDDYYDRKFVGEPVKSPVTEQDFFTARGPWDTPMLTVPHPMVRDPKLNKIDDTWYATSSPPGGKISESLNAGVVIMKSKDLKKWSPLNLPERENNPASKEGLLPWDKVPVYSFGDMRDDQDWPKLTEKKWNKGHSVWAPVINRVKGDFYILCWMGGVYGKQFISPLLKSQSGRPEGPYKIHMYSSEDTCQIIENQQDGTVWQVSGIGVCSQLKDDLSGFVKPKVKKTLLIADGSCHAGDTGCSIVRVGKRYFLYLVESRGDYGGALFWSDKFLGPYHRFGSLPYTGYSGIAGPDENGTWYIIPQTMGPYAAPKGLIENGNVVLPLHFEPESSPPVIYFPWEKEMFGKAVYQ